MAEWICDKRCFQCKHPDCINDQPASLKEIAIIEADDRYVRWLQLSDTEKRKREVWKDYQKKHYAAHKDEIAAKRNANKEAVYARTRAWHKKRREGNAP